MNTKHARYNVQTIISRKHTQTHMEQSCFMLLMPNALLRHLISIVNILGRQQEPDVQSFGQIIYAYLHLLNLK